MALRSIGGEQLKIAQHPWENNIPALQAQQG
jgi:hypothetical protein